MDDCSVDTALVHQANGLLGGERRDLPMRQIARQAAAPDVDLGINDPHRILSSRYVPSTSGAQRRLGTSTSRTVGFPEPGQHGQGAGMALQGVGIVCLRDWT